MKRAYVAIAAVLLASISAGIAGAAGASGDIDVAKLICPPFPQELCKDH